jgi:hypothetical protein
MTKSVRLAQVRTCLRGGQCEPDGVRLEQRVAGSLFEFSLSHTARSETAVVPERERPRRSVTPTGRRRIAVRAEVCEADARSVQVTVFGRPF